MLLLSVTDCFYKLNKLFFYNFEEIRFIFNALIRDRIEKLLILFIQLHCVHSYLVANKLFLSEL